MSLALGACALVALAGARRGRHAAVAPPPEGHGGDVALEARLERERQVVLRRIAAKREAVLDLFAGRLSLPEAVALFGRLNGGPADCPCRDGHLHPGASRGEALGRQVLDWARATARAGEPGCTPRRLARLEGELKALLARGALLPEAPPAP